VRADLPTPPEPTMASLMRVELVLVGRMGSRRIFDCCLFILYFLIRNYIIINEKVEQFQIAWVVPNSNIYMGNVGRSKFNHWRTNKYEFSCGIRFKLWNSGKVVASLLGGNHSSESLAFICETLSL